MILRRQCQNLYHLLVSVRPVVLRLRQDCEYGRISDPCTEQQVVQLEGPWRFLSQSPAERIAYFLLMSKKDPATKLEAFTIEALLPKMSLGNIIGISKKYATNTLVGNFAALQDLFLSRVQHGALSV